jgi:hypothetical protein
VALTIEYVGVIWGVTDECKDKTCPTNVQARAKIRDRGSAKKQIATAAANGKEYVHGKNNGLLLITPPRLTGARPSS